MIVLKTARELSLMREACKISARALKIAGEAVQPGVSTLEIDTLVRKYIEKRFSGTADFRTVLVYR